MNGEASIAIIYKLTVAFGVAGAVAVYLWLGGVRPAGAFVLGACGSLGNLWLFDWLSRSIAPAGGSRKPWRAGVFATRYLLLIGIGYVIVSALGVTPLPVVLGLLTNAAAALSAALLGLALPRRISH